MEIEQFIWGVVDSNSWLMTEDNNGLLIDAIDDERLYHRIKYLDSLTVILTHSHFDHICGLNCIRELRSDVNVISTRICSDNIGSIYKNMSSSATAFMVFYNGTHDAQIDPIVCKPSNEVFDIDYQFNWFGHNINLLDVHGHSADSLLAIIDNTLLFSGDTLLSIPTVTRFPSGSTTKFWNEDIPKLKQMNSIQRVYPGHGDSGLLLDMIAINKRPEKK